MILNRRGNGNAEQKQGQSRTKPVIRRSHSFISSQQCNRKKRVDNEIITLIGRKTDENDRDMKQSPWPMELPKLTVLNVWLTINITGQSRNHDECSRNHGDRRNKHAKAKT